MLARKVGATIALGVIGFVVFSAAYSYLHPDDAPPYVFSLPDNNSNPAISLLTVEQRISFAKETHDLINQHRIVEGLRPLNWNDDLARVATTHSEWMADTGRYEHSTTFCRAENIVMDNGWLSPREAVSSWMGSADHRRNILNPAYGTEGIAISQDSDGRTYYTQNLC